eukprot:Nk52_evm2s160 gene=Nk52_evmTU2s160
MLMRSSLLKFAMFALCVAMLCNSAIALPAAIDSPSTAATEPELESPQTSQSVTIRQQDAVEAAMNGQQYQFATGDEFAGSVGSSVTDVLLGYISNSPFSADSIDPNNIGAAQCIQQSAYKSSASFQYEADTVSTSFSLDQGLEFGATSFGTHMSMSEEFSMSEAASSESVTVTYAYFQGYEYSLSGANCDWSSETLDAYGCSSNTCDDKTDQFISNFGTGYVYSVTAGCMGFLSLTYRFESQESKLDFQSKIGATGVWGHMSSELQMAYASSEQHIEATSACELHGFKGQCETNYINVQTGEIDTDSFDNMINQAECKLGEGANIYSVITQGYGSFASVSELAINPLKVMYNVSAADINTFQNAKEVNEELLVEIENCIGQNPTACRSGDYGSINVNPLCYESDFFADRTAVAQYYCNSYINNTQLQNEMDATDYNDVPSVAQSFQEQADQLTSLFYQQYNKRTPIRVDFSYSMSQCDYNYAVALNDLSIYFYINVPNGKVESSRYYFQDTLTEKVMTPDQTYGTKGYGLNETIGVNSLTFTRGNQETSNTISSSTSLPHKVTDTLNGGCVMTFTIHNIQNVDDSEAWDSPYQKDADGMPTWSSSSGSDTTTLSPQPSYLKMNEGSVTSNRRPIENLVSLQARNGVFSAYQLFNPTTDSSTYHGPYDSKSSHGFQRPDVVFFASSSDVNNQPLSSAMCTACTFLTYLHETNNDKQKDTTQGMNVYGVNNVYTDGVSSSNHNYFFGQETVRASDIYYYES